jgi:two-component system, NtrC family, sensor kinase
MTTPLDHIPVDPFDREYDLTDLFPIPLARELLSTIDGRLAAAILLGDGGLYFNGGAVQQDYTPYIKQPAQDHTGGPKLVVEGRRRWVVGELTHELETIGFLVLEAGGEPPITDDALLRMGQFVARLINRLIDLNYRNRMTAGLHGQVVADSYASLKQKAEQLARSEEKYRNLAENLEIEVKRQTRTIEAAQLRILQQEKMAAVGQLAAGMAHEINNPVGFVISNLGTLKTTTQEVASLIAQYRRLADLLTDHTTKEGTAARIKEQLAAISRLTEKMDLDFVLEDTGNLIDESLDGAKRVKIIVQNLREFTHPSIESAESVDFNDCLETTLAILSNYGAPAIRITRHYGEIPLVTCHLREINQVFYNILKNAYQAIGDQGEITITTAADDEAVIVCIADTGCGIEGKHLGSIFDPFYTTREVGSGIGLGLFHAYHTVHTLGGTIAVESRPGSGSTFTIKVPRPDSAPTNNGRQTP